MKDNTQNEILERNITNPSDEDLATVKDCDQENQVVVEKENTEIQNSQDNPVLIYIKNMSSFEKLFWATIIILFIIYSILLIRASTYISTTDNNSSNTSVSNIFHEIEVIVHSDRMKKNLENNITAEKIKENLKDNITYLNKEIEKEIDFAFDAVYDNIDIFLDFHYSVVGEYIELGGMATGTVEKTIEEKLFGSTFSNRIKDAMKDISEEYEMKVSDHFNFISQKATIEVDLNLNPQIVQNLEKDISRNMSIQKGKMGAFATAAVAPAIIKVASKKIAAKSSSKIAAKIAAKLSAKSAAAATGAASGTLCGPAFWICSPIAAGVLWFGTDAVINSIDELYNRDEFKQDIMDSLLIQQDGLKERLKTSYEESMQKISDEILLQYKQTPTKEKKRIKISDQLGL